MDWLEQAYEVMTEGLSALLSPLLYPFDPSRRIFIGFVFVALVMGYYYYQKHLGKKGLRAFFAFFFDKEIWLHPSSRTDFKLLFANSLVAASLIAPFILAKLTIVVWVSSGLRNEFGVVEGVMLPYWGVLLLFTLVLFLAEDFKRFIVHYAFHRIPLLWAFHKVHHSAEVLTPITLYRTHPVETFISRFSSVLVLGTVTGVFVYLFPGKLSAVEILGVDALGFMFNALGANLRHSHIPFSFGKLNRWIISPHMHQVHHSVDSRHFDRNFGSCFAFWDRLWGTLYIPHAEEKLNFGCKDGGKHTLTSQWLRPFIQAGSIISLRIIGARKKRVARQTRIRENKMDVRYW